MSVAFPALTQAVPHRRSVSTELVAVGACLLAAIFFTWPMAAHFTSRLGGDPGDPFQTLWSWRWMRDALLSGQNPFFTDRVFFPHGSSLVFQTFDLPTAILTVPLWSVLSPFGVYNAGVLFAFWLTAYGMYRLVRELTGDWLVAICAGVLFTATPYHLAHAQGHQHLVSMGWLPLYLVHLHRMIEGRGGWRDALLGGLFLALASLASWYHLLYAIVLTPVLFVDGAIRHRRSMLSARFASQAVALALIYLAVAGPLLLAILFQRADEPVAGAHDAVRFSGDLQAFVFPNLVQRWAESWGGHAMRWSGNAAETALYAGFALTATAILGALFAGGRARAYLVMALVGAVLALGPHLHVGGRIFHDVELPYAYLVKVLPQIEFMGVPVRLGYVMYLGLIVAASLALARVRALIDLRWLGVALVLVPVGLTLYEYRPRPFIQTEAPSPAPMLEWADDPSKFAVLDLSDDYRMMWHATLHRKPMTGGNITRVPQRLEDWYWGLPIVKALRHPGRRLSEALVRVDPAIDFDWGFGGPDPAVGVDGFEVNWTGTLRVPSEGRWTFWLTSDDGSRLMLDGRTVVDHRGIHPMTERSGQVELAAGEHPLALHYVEATGSAGVRLEWEGPGQARQVVPAGALVGPEGEAGLRGVYRRGKQSCGLEREQGERWLREIGVRYIVTGPAGHDCVADELRLPEIFAGDGVRIYGLAP